MNVVDSSAWLEYLADGPNAGRFAGAIENTADLVVPSICVLEVFKRVLQQRDEQSALQAVAVMHQGAITDLTAEIAIDAARLGLEFKLPLADSVVLATARVHSATLWTQGSDFKGIEGVKFFAKK
ncbi:MAG TPA: type II toxin-antitoxin system VapC family toxin [Terriglobia bacterium]|nr:type II toxin-antitoxin system VapC family toxin [Terriglobia bacterium]